MLFSDTQCSFVNYGLFAFVEQSYMVLMPLVLAASILYGGLGLSPFTIGFIMSSFGMIFGLSSVLFFLPLSQRFGYRRIYRITFSCYSIAILIFPLMNYSARRTGMVNTVMWALVAVLMVCSGVVTMAYGEFFLKNN